MARAYTSPLRQAAGESTRRRVLDAAAALFVRQGYGATSLREIADEAGVSLQTVHLHGPKSALLMAAYELAIAGREGFALLGDEEPMRAVAEAPDLGSALDSYADAMTAALGRFADLYRAVRGAADADPAVRPVWTAIEDRRVNSIREGVQRIAEAGMIPISAVEDAATLIGLLVSADNYLYLRAAGWSVDRYRGWLRDQLGGLAARVSEAPGP